MSPRAAAVLVVGAGLAFGTSGPLARYAEPADPLAIVCGRTLIAALVLLLVDARGIFRALAALDGRARMGVAAAGVVLAAHFTLFVWGLLRTSLPAAMALISLEPAAVVLIAFGVHGVRPRRAEIVGLVLATAGAAVVASGAGSGQHRLDGDLLVLGAVVLYGVYLAAARSLRAALPPRSYVALVYAAAAVSAGLALLVAPSSAATVRWPLPPHSLAAIAALALLPTLVGHTAVQTAARHASPALVGLVSPGETVASVLIGIAWFGAIPTAREIAGGLVIVAGVTVAVVAQRAAAAGAAR